MKDRRKRFTIVGKLGETEYDISPYRFEIQRRHSAIGWLTPIEFENKKPSTVA